MGEDTHELGRRRFLQAAGAGVAGVAALRTGVTPSRAGRAETAPGEDEYGEILSAMDGEGTEDDPYVVTDVVELQAMAGDVTAGYELGDDIDASPTADWNDGAGFDPIYRDGDEPTEDDVEDAPENTPAGFSGWLQGNEHEISGLTVDRPDGPGSGLVLVNEGAVVDLAITDADVTGSVAGIVAASNAGGIAEVTVEGTASGEDSVGGVVGVNEGVVNEAVAGVDVAGDDRVGGVAGRSAGTIAESTASGTVEGSTYAGGFVGQDSGTLQASEADVDVTGTAMIGGFAGEVAGTVNGCSAAGSVVGESTVGGFAGECWADLLGSTASGPVDGEEQVGGLVGTSYGEIRVCAAHGEVSGGSTVGGLVGWGASGSLAADVYSVGGVEGEEAVGSLVGLLGWEFLGDGETAELRRAYWSVDDAPHDPVGLVETGDGDVIAEDETLEGLERSQFTGEDVVDQLTLFDFDREWLARADETPIPRAQAPSVFEIRDVSTREIVVGRDETFALEFTVENTGEWEGTQSIGLIVGDRLLDSVERTLDPGESERVTLEGLQAADISAGNHAWTLRTRNDAVDGTIEVTDASDTPGDGDGDETPTGNGSDDADDEGPGFGAGAAVAGVSAGAYLLSRRAGQSRADE